LRRFAVRIAEIQRRTGIPHESVLRDHALSYMLAGIFSVEQLGTRLIFKGGTALRKCYFADYRYSEDLDFSTRDLHAWTTDELTQLLTAACAAAEELAEQIEAPYKFSPRAETHREDRTDTQHNFRIGVEFPTGARLPVKFELTQAEPIVRPLERRRLIHGFRDEALDLELPAYSLDEVVLEKLRAFLQTASSLDRRNWTNRSRDLYDLWWLWSQEAAVSWDELLDPLMVKASARDVTFSGPEDFLDVRVLRAYRDGWGTRLSNVVPVLPPFEDALRALQEVLSRVFATESLPDVRFDDEHLREE
jgi:predicted nucleotidyltransferase component of viral defense system